MKKRELMKRVAVIAFVGFVVLALSSLEAFSQTTEYPNKPIKLIVGFGPGSASDTAARILGEQLRVELGQAIVVENKTGAVGLVALEGFARSAPDGYTLMVGNTNSNFLAPNAYKSKIKIDPAMSIKIITRIGFNPYLFLATTKIDFPVKTWQEFLAYAKANPGKVRYTSGGAGSNTHYDLVAMFKRLGLDMVHIPPGAAGGPAMLKAMITGDSHVGVVGTATIGGFVKSGELIALAAWSKERLDDYPNVPSLKELGCGDLMHENWMMLLAPIDTPTNIVNKLDRATQSALKNPKVKEAYQKTQFYIEPSANPEAAKKWMATEFEQWRRLVSESSIKLE